MAAIPPTEGRVVLRVVAVAAVVGVIVVGTIFARDASEAERLVHIARLRTTQEDEKTGRADCPGLSDVTLLTSDQLRLQGWFCPGPTRAAIVFVHGGGGNRIQLLPEARALARHGYGYLVYDARASGDSDGDLVTWGDREQRDVAAAIDFVAGRSDVDPRRIAVVGFSIGASSVALETVRDPRASAIVLYATWPSLEDEIKRKYAAQGILSWGPILYRLRHSGVDVDAVRPIDALGQRRPRPLLMIAGSDDRDTPVDVMRRLFDAARPPKELWIVPGAGHGGDYAAAPAEYEARLVRFLEAAWTDAPPAPSSPDP